MPVAKTSVSGHALEIKKVNNAKLRITFAAIGDECTESIWKLVQRKLHDFTTLIFETDQENNENTTFFWNGKC